MKLSDDIIESLEYRGPNVLKLVTGEQIIADLYSPMKNSSFTGYYFLKTPLTVTTRISEENGQPEKALVPWIDAESVFLEDEYVIVRRDFILAFDKPIRGAIDTWIQQARNYREMIGQPSQSQSLFLQGGKEVEKEES